MKKLFSWLRNPGEERGKTTGLALTPDIFSFDMKQADRLDQLFLSGLEKKINDKRWVEDQVRWLRAMAAAEAREPDKEKIRRYSPKSKTLTEITADIASSGNLAADNPEFRNILYVMYVLDTALQDIKTFVPGWKDSIEKFKNNCFVYPHSDIATHIPADAAVVFLDFSPGSPGRFNFILNDYLTAVHELAHGLVYTALRQEDSRTANDLSHESNDFYKALQEAVAISLEQSAIRNYSIPQPPHKVGTLFGMMSRGKHALSRFQALRRKKSAFRKQYPQAEQIRVAGEPGDSYTEGVRMAKWFERHGWTVADIPKILKRVSQAGQNEIGKSNLELLFSIPTREPDLASQNDSRYMRIIRRALKG